MPTPAEMIPLDAILGNESNRNSSAALYLFWLPRASDSMARAEVGMDTAVRVSTTLRKEWANVTNAYLDRDGEVGGRWSDTRYLVTEGTVLKLWGEKTAWGVVAGKAAVVLLCSKDAPVNRVSIKLSELPTATRQEASITGQFWVLNRDTMKEYPGLPALNRQAEHFCSPVFIQEVFKLHECVPAPEKAMAMKTVAKEVNTGSPIVAAGNHTTGLVTLLTRKGKRVMG